MEPAVIVALISLTGVCVTSFVGPLIMNRANNKRDQKREEKREKELEERRKEEAIKEQKDQEWQQRVENMVKPIGNKVDNIEQRLSAVEVKQDKIKTMLLKNEDATILSLRVDMKSIRDRIVDNKLIPDQGEKITWRELYKTYHKHGGNHFKEAVDEWGKDMGFTQDELDSFKRDDK